MADEPPKKKRKAGGSFCAVGDCSNRSSRNKISAHENRGFLRYVKMPKDETRRRKWILRMKREPRSFNPSPSTKICTDHFFLEDFREDDVAAHLSRVSEDQEKTIPIRLKPDSVPNTDRATGNFADPLCQAASSRKNPLSRARTTVTEADSELQAESPDLSLADLDIEMPASSEYETDFDEEESEFDEDFTHTAELLNSSFSEEADPISETGPFSAEHDASDDFPVTHEDVKSFTDKACWALVNVSILLSLLKFCPECGAHNVIKNIKTFGFAIVVRYRCCGIETHDGIWRSSPLTKRLYICNLLFSAATYMCGISYSALESLMICVSMPYISCNRFYRNNSVNLYPIIVDKWVEIRDAVVQTDTESEEDDEVKLNIAGDGHHDSPGFCAKFCTYSILNLNTGAIVDFFVAQKGMYTGELETSACREVLTNMTKRGLKFNHFVTDENTKIAKLVRNSFPKINHNYDVWHKARLIKRKLQKMAEKLPKISDFVNTLVNHFWYSCKNCAGDPKILLQRFHSSLLHLVNKHRWTADPFKPLKLRLQSERNENRKRPVNLPSEKLYPMFQNVKKCEHALKAKHRKMRGMKWLDIDSDEFLCLFKYFTDSRFIKSVQMCCNFLHTGALEVYHNVRLRMLPKRTSYSLKRMIVSSMVTAIEINRNLPTDNSKYKTWWQYSKSQKRYISKTRMVNKDYSYRREILTAMINYISEGKKPRDISEMLKDENYVKREISKNITGLTRPVGKPTLNVSRF